MTETALHSAIICGPPASGKSRLAVERFRQIEGSILVVPTATMAEHLGHEFARSGELVRPSRIVTLSGLVDQWARSKAAPPSLVQFHLTQALERSAPERFERVADSRGFRSALTSLLDELPPDRKASAEIEAIRTAVVAGLGRSGRALRLARIDEAAAYKGSLAPHYVFDGFFDLSESELRLLRSLASRTAITVVTTDAGVAERLTPAPIQWTSTKRRSPQLALVEALTAEQEASEVARRILELIGEGKSFRDIGIVVRSAQPMGPLLETTLHRFGIPVRSYFPRRLASMPSTAFVVGLLRAAIDGWDWEALAGALRYLPPSDEGDAFDLWLREHVPGRGLELPDDVPVPPYWPRLVRVARWIKDRRMAADWAERVASLPGEFFTAREGDALALRAEASAQRAFASALEEAALAFDAGTRIPFERFWEHAETCVELASLYARDGRRDVVHLMDVHEARQWELSTVFVCGMLEREFPRYHSEDPLIGDAARKRLGLKTAAERLDDEARLFQIATTRATQATYLSYARLNEKGEATLPSFFLADLSLEPQAARGAVPAALPARSAERKALAQEELTTKLRKRHRALSPSAVESFLQCPYQFFARYTLGLKEFPAEPKDRTDALFQGSVIHKALAEYIERPMLGASVLEAVFEDACREHNIPRGYRTESVRLELLRNFELFLRGGELPLTWAQRVEQKFQVDVTGDFAIRGRLDRLDISSGRALVVDYKYSLPNNVRKRVREAQAGKLVQGGLYMLAAQLAFGLDPAGMLYCGVKGQIEWGGWFAAELPLKGYGAACSSDALSEVMLQARRLAIETHERVLAGENAPAPTDEGKCGLCSYRDICRVEAAPAAIGAAS